VDTFAVTTKDHPVRVVSLFRRSGVELRAVPSTIQAIENNLSIANMSLANFARAADSMGILRRFSL
jgi:hypothetical protein